MLLCLSARHLCAHVLVRLFKAADISCSDHIQWRYNVWLIIWEEEINVGYETDDRSGHKVFSDTLLLNRRYTIQSKVHSPHWFGPTREWPIYLVNH